MKKNIVFLGALVFAVSLFNLSAGLAAAPTSDLSIQKVVMLETPAEKEARLRWWRAARFGMLIHWGPVTSSAFRLEITDATDGPTIWEIKL